MMIFDIFFNWIINIDLLVKKAEIELKEATIPVLEGGKTVKIGFKRSKDMSQYVSAWLVS